LHVHPPVDLRILTPQSIEILWCLLGSRSSAARSQWPLGNSLTSHSLDGFDEDDDDFDDVEDSDDGFFVRDELVSDGTDDDDDVGSDDDDDDDDDDEVGND